MALVRSHIVWVAIMIYLVCYCRSVMAHCNGETCDAHVQNIAACNQDPDQLVPCYPAAVGNVSIPSSACCSVLNDLGFQNDVGYRCLCDAIRRLPIEVNKTAMLELTKACGLAVVKCGDFDPDPPAKVAI